MNQERRTQGLLPLLLIVSCTVPNDFEQTWRTNKHDRNREQPANCGDGDLNANEGERCDDGNRASGDGCDELCQPEGRCGNNTVDQGEECDDGNLESGDGCDEQCLEEKGAETCGNNTVDEGETCDDGNRSNGDGCNEDCQTEEDGPCGNSTVDEGEECDDGNQIDDDLCDNNCQLINCAEPGSEGEVGDKRCSRIDDDAVCVVADTDHPVCLLRDLGYETPEFLRASLFHFCARSDEGPIPEEAHRCRNSDDCDGGEQCYLFDVPDKFQGLCWVSEEPDFPEDRPPNPLVPGWAVHTNPGGVDDGSDSTCKPMACSGLHEGDYCRVREALEHDTLSAYCSDSISQDVVDDAGSGVCVIAECTGNNEHVSRPCKEIFSVNEAVCNHDGYCVGLGGDDDKMCSEEDLPYACGELCQPAHCRNCHGDGCQGCGGAAFDLCEWPPGENDLRCLSCLDDNDCPHDGGANDGSSDYRCFKRPGQAQNDPGTCRLSCEGDDDCRVRHGGRCVGPQGGQRFCELQGGGQQHGPGCGRDNDCQSHERCDQDEGRCVPRRCDQGCPEGTRCNQDHQHCEPEHGGGGGPEMIEICGNNDECRAQHYCQQWAPEDPGICLPNNCRDNPCPGGHSCEDRGDHGECVLMDGCQLEDRGCGHPIALRECVQIPGHAGGELCEYQANTDDGRCRSNDDCRGGVCRPTKGDCINWGDACDGAPTRFPGYCRDVHQAEAQNCNPLNANECNNGYRCDQAQDHVGQEGLAAERGICAGNACERNGDCAFGQACFFDGEEGQCKGRLLCRGPTEEACPESQACVPLYGYGLHGGDFCVEGRSCDAHDDCADGFGCSNGLCIGHHHDCEGLGGVRFDSMCVPTIRAAGDEDRNDWLSLDEGGDDWRTFGFGGVIDFVLEERDQDVFRYLDEDDSGTRTFTVRSSDQRQHHIPPVKCFLVQFNEEGTQVLDEDDAWEGEGCTLEVEINEGEPYLFVIHRLDMLEDHPIGDLRLRAD